MIAFYEFLKAILAGVGTLALISIAASFVYVVWSMALDITAEDKRRGS